MDSPTGSSDYSCAFVVCSGCVSLVLSGLVLLTALSRLILGYVSCASTLRAMFFSAELEFRYWDC